MPTGCLTPYAKLLQYSSDQFRAQTIQYTNQVKGFLCNAQIPLMWLFATTARGRMAEIGCWYGRTTTVLLTASGGVPQLGLHCVDTFRGSEEHQDELKGHEFRADFENTLRLRGLLDSVAEIVQKPSVEAAAQYPDHYFDHVWIDAAHDYANVVADVRAWTPKLKSGGLLLGHDYPEPTDPNGGFEELTRAVNGEVRDAPQTFTDFGWFCGIWAARKV